MRKILILLAAIIILFSGCIAQNSGNQSVGNQKTVKIGDNVSVDYIGSLNGTVFDTSIETVAKENNLYTPNRTYEPLLLTVGKEQTIKGFDEGIVGMKVGESKTLIIPPEKAYGPKNPQMIQTIPIVQNVPLTRTFPKAVEISTEEFNSIFGNNHKNGDNVKVPNADVNLTIVNMTKTSNVSLLYDLSVGDNISAGAPWNDTVIKVDDKNITVRSEVKKNTTFRLKDDPWTTTVTNVDSNNMTMMRNIMPDTKIPNSSARISFNNTHIIIDYNSELAGETLNFNVTIRSIG
jgi:peptidylprolyl isomerase